MKDYYRILGLDRNCSQEKIKKTYRYLVQKFHPDKCQTADSSRFRDIQEAYEAIGSAEKRKKYDDELKQLEEKQSRNLFQRQGFWQQVRPTVSPLNFMQHLLDGTDVSDFLTSGSHYDFEIILSREEAAAGVSLPIELQVNRSCRNCGGSGFDSFWGAICNDCSGTGKVIEPFHFYIEIPPQIRPNLIYTLNLKNNSSLQVRILVS